MVDVSSLSKILDETIVKADISPLNLQEQILLTKRVFVLGAGRSGLVAKIFAMRLMHIGKVTYVVGDVTTPRIEKNDLLIVITGSGKTTSIVNNVKIAKSIGSKVISLTTNVASEVAEYSDDIILFDVKSKCNYTQEDNILPLGTLFELSSLLTLETVIANLIEKLEINEGVLRSRHTNLE